MVGTRRSVPDTTSSRSGVTRSSSARHSTGGAGSTRSATSVPGTSLNRGSRRTKQAVGKNVPEPSNVGNLQKPEGEHVGAGERESVPAEGGRGVRGKRQRQLSQKMQQWVDEQQSAHNRKINKRKQSSDAATSRNKKRKIDTTESRDTTEYRDNSTAGADFTEGNTDIDQQADECLPYTDQSDVVCDSMVVGEIEDADINHYGIRTEVVTDHNISSNAEYIVDSLGHPSYGAEIVYFETDVESATASKQSAVNIQPNLSQTVDQIDIISGQSQTLGQLEIQDNSSLVTEQVNIPSGQPQATEGDNQPLTVQYDITSDSDQLPMASEQSDQLTLTTEQTDQLAMTTEQSDQLAMASEQSDQLVLTTEHSGQLVMTTEQSDQLAMTSEQSDQLAITTEQSDQLVMTSEQSGQLVMTTEQSDQLAMTSEQSHQLVMTTEQSDQLVMTTEQSDQLTVTSEQSDQLAMVNEQADQLVLACAQTDHLANQQNLQSEQSHESIQLNFHSDLPQPHFEVADQSEVVVGFTDQSEVVVEQSDNKSQSISHMVSSEVDRVALPSDSLSEARTVENQVGVMLSNDDSVTQALLESFLVENSKEQRGPQSSPTVTTQIAPTLKLTEHIEIDENGKKQTVVYLLPDTANTSASATTSTAVSGLKKNILIPTSRQRNSAASSQLQHLQQTNPVQQIMDATKMCDAQSERRLPVAEETTLAAQTVSRVSREEGLTRLQVEQTNKVLSKQSVCTVTPDGEVKRQEVIIEVVVDNDAKGDHQLQSLRVIQPYNYSKFIGANSQVQSVYTCNECDYKTDRRNYLIKHIKIHQELRQHVCTFAGCGYISKTVSNLRRHQLSHTDERNFPCLECNLKFKQKIHLDKHVNYIHRVRSVECAFCDYVCANKIPDLKLHMKRKHLKNDSEDPPTYLECDKCGFLAGCKQDLKQHFKFHKRGPELKLFCEHCSFVTDAKSRLERHLMIHTKEKPYSCSVCPYKASQKEHIKRHFRNWHAGRPILAENKHLVGEEHSEQAPAPTTSTSQEEITQEETTQEETTQEGITQEGITQEGITQEGTTQEGTTQEGTTQEETTQEETTQEEITQEETTQEGTTQEETLQQQTSPLDDFNKQAALDVGEIVIEESSQFHHIICDDNEQSTTVSGEDLERKEQQSVTSSAASSDKKPNNDVKPVTTSSKSAVKYQPPDYSEKPKSFACTHCTMKFVKLLSLYKHLHAQHSDILPNTQEEKRTCVVCDFRAPSHNSLLVHMRKHSNQDTSEERDEPGMLYVCVLCKYTNSKRKNLYQHMKKKHKISIMVKKDGTASCVVEPNADVTVVASSQGQEVTEVIGVNQMSASVADQMKVVNVLDLANSLTHKHDLSHLIQKVEMPCSHPEQDAAEAIVDLATQNIDLTAQTLDLASQNISTEEITPTTAILEADESGQGQLQISAQQLHSLSSGDYIEINGETYKVELQGDAMTAVLCQQVVTHEMVITEDDRCDAIQDMSTAADVTNNATPSLSSPTTDSVVIGDNGLVTVNVMPDADELAVVSHTVSQVISTQSKATNNIVSESDNVTQVVSADIVSESDSGAQVVSTDMVLESDSGTQVVSADIVPESDNVTQVVSVDMVEESDIV